MGHKFKCITRAKRENNTKEAVIELNDKWIYDWPKHAEVTAKKLVPINFDDTFEYIGVYPHIFRNQI